MPNTSSHQGNANQATVRDLVPRGQPHFQMENNDVGEDVEPPEPSCAAYAGVQSFILGISAAAVQSGKQGHHCQTKKIQEAANKKIDFIWGFKDLGGTDSSNLKRCSK